MLDEPADDFSDVDMNHSVTPYCTSAAGISANASPIPATATDASHIHNHLNRARPPTPSTGLLTAIPEKITRLTAHGTPLRPTNTGTGASTTAPSKTTTVAAPSALPPPNCQRQGAPRIIPFLPVQAS